MSVSRELAGHQRGLRATKESSVYTVCNSVLLVKPEQSGMWIVNANVFIGISRILSGR